MDKPKLQFTSAAVSDRGLSAKRPVNEDSYLEMNEQKLFVVADGVGGAQAGDFASQTAVEVLYEAFSHPPANVSVAELMEKAIQHANASIYQMSRDLPQLSSMATTIVALQLDGNVATVGHVGDSRLYRFDSNGMLHRETEDHSVVEQEVRAGRMTLTQAANHPSRNVINRALGADSQVDVEMRTVAFEPGTKFLLCSDGVTRHISDAELRGILSRNQTLIEACREIKNVCYNRGAEDNLTAVIVSVENAQAINANRFTDDNEENTITRRPFAPNPLPALSNANNYNLLDENQTSKREANFDEQFVEAPTAPLKTDLIGGRQPATNFDDAETATASAQVDREPQTILKPGSQTIGITENGAASIESEATLPSKFENQRIREKIDSAAPLSGYDEPARSASGIGKILPALLLLLAGSIIGAGLYYLLAGTPAQSDAAQKTSTEPVAQALPTVSDLTPQEINEFRTYERVRRTIDAKPNAEPAVAQPQSAADYYLRGRALLETGKYDQAREALLQAEKLLPQAEGITPESLRVDIAIAQAAVAAMTQAGSTKRMLNDVVKSKQSNSAPVAPAAR